MSVVHKVINCTKATSLLMFMLNYKQQPMVKQRESLDVVDVNTVVVGVVVVVHSALSISCVREHANDVSPSLLC